MRFERFGSVREREHEENEDEDGVGALSHYANSASGMGVAQTAWECSEGGKEEPEPVTLDSVNEILQAAQASQRREKSMAGAVKEAAALTGTLRELTAATSEDVRRWLKEIKVERNAEEKRLLNDEQYKMVEKVAGSVIEELDAGVEVGAQAGEPLCWMLHGGLEPVSRM